MSFRAAKPISTALLIILFPPVKILVAVPIISTIKSATKSIK